MVFSFFPALADYSADVSASSTSSFNISLPDNYIELMRALFIGESVGAAASAESDDQMKAGISNIEMKPNVVSNEKEDATKAESDDKDDQIKPEMVKTEDIGIKF